jgi:hypothetical protein
MAFKIRRWQRDLDIEAALTRWPLTNAHIAVLCGFPSPKKAAQRTNKLHGAGFLKRFPFFQPSMQGKPEFLYGVKHSQFRERTMLHDHRIAALHVATAQWLATAAWDGEFYYTHELATSGGIIPDATLVLRKGEKHGLFFFEVDNGTEPVTSLASYSLAKKLGLYATYFDNQTFAHDFVHAGTFSGFRVCIVLPPGRRKQVLDLLRREQYDFVMLTSFDRLRDGFGSPVWSTTECESVDLLGRRGELLGEMIGEIIRPAVPTSTTNNTCNNNTLAQAAKSEIPYPARTGQDQ